MKKIIIIAVAIIVIAIVGIFVIKSYDSDKNSNVTVGLVLNGSADDHSWSQSHYESMVNTSEKLGLNLIYRENVADADIVTVAEELIAEGSEIVICNSFGYGEYLDEIAEKHPDVYFFHASGINNSSNICTYFGRMYQIRYLCGVAAGLQTETDEIGYVAAFPISEVNRGINAFTLGVRSVNPDAEVYVNWTNSWVDDSAAEAASLELINNHDIDILTMHVDSLSPLEAADKNGIMSIGYNYNNINSYPNTFLTAAVWDWEKFYTPRIMECLQGEFKGKNYWEGVNTGIVSLAPVGTSAKNNILEAVDAERERFRSGTFDVFYGPIYDNEGNIRIAEGESMTDDAMLNSFDWYVEGVVADEK